MLVKERENGVKRVRFRAVHRKENRELQKESQTEDGRFDSESQENESS